MRPLLYLLTAMAVMGLAFWAYRENYRTQTVIDEMQGVQNEIAGLRDNLGVLRAEWAYLNRPDRLRELVDMNFDRLRLVPVGRNQFGGDRNVDYPPPPAPPGEDGAGADGEGADAEGTANAGSDDAAAGKGAPGGAGGTAADDGRAADAGPGRAPDPADAEAPTETPDETADETAADQAVTAEDGSVPDVSPSADPSAADPSAADPTRPPSAADAPAPAAVPSAPPPRNPRNRETQP